MMEYQGYIGQVEYDDEAGIFHGEVLNTRDVITFQGTTVRELKKAFQESVKDYLAFCRERGEDPDRPYSGQFVTRISPELHRQASVAAALSGKSLNAWVTDQIRSTLRSNEPVEDAQGSIGVSSVKTRGKKPRMPAQPL